MPEDYLRLSALASLGLAARSVADRAPEQGIALRELPLPGLLSLRFSPTDKAVAQAASNTLNLKLPEMGGVSLNGSVALYRLGPDEWWIKTNGPAMALEEKLRAAFGGGHTAVIEIGEGWTQIEASGPQARALLAKGCPLDFHPRAFRAGEVRQSLLSKADAVYRLVSDEQSEAELVFEITVRRSFADYAWRWLADAAAEYGLAVLD
ncbi:sarcosine oxidase subunit gamma [Algihabitans albus]|uniref:sarcosine oxidase subunit gamma n=1 Tax=Algihabitans albus TaxID=2164067 RepID=UPI0013C33349|nr:sarcosine oxidase subunit gamma family protein [Algihabitans albus]